MVFAALRWVFRTGASEFQTIWFEISLITELVVVLILRTRRLCWKSRRGRLLVWTIAPMVLLGFALPDFDALFSFERPSWQMLGFVCVVVAICAAATEMAKRRFYGDLTSR